MNDSPSKMRIGFILIVAFAASAFFFLTIYRLLQTPSSRAAGETVDVSFTPSSGSVGVGQGSDKTADIIITAPEGKGIAGVDINVSANNLKITDIAEIKAVGATTPLTINNITSNIATDGSSATRSTVVVEPDEKLPKVVSLQVRFQCVKVGTGVLSVDKSKSEIVGNITGNIYDIKASQATFNCGDGGTEAPPTSGGPTANVRFAPHEKTARVGETFSYHMYFDGLPAGKGISTFDVKLQYDKSLLEVVKIGDMIDRLPAAGNTGTFSTLANLGFLNNSCVTDADCKAAGFCADLARTMCLPCKNGFCGGVSSTAPTPIPGGGPGTGGVPTGPAGGPGMPNPTGGVKPTDIPGGQPVPPQDPGTGGDRDPQPTPGTGSGGNDGVCTMFVKDYATPGEISLVYICSVSQDKLPKNPGFLIDFKAKAVGTGSIDIVRARATGNIPEVYYDVKRHNASYTLSGTAGPTAEIKLKLKMRFQGVEKKPSDRMNNNFTVKCTLKNDTLSRPVTAAGKFSADDKGVWTGDPLTFNAPVGSGYTLLCKGPNHIQKKFCVAKPEESYPGTYGCDRGAITLSAGLNDLDLSGVTQLVGDLPDQNGIVNSYDTSLCRNLLEKDDAESQRLSDLNGDGIVNSVDCALVTSALAIKLDDQ